MLKIYKTFIVIVLTFSCQIIKTKSPDTDQCTTQTQGPKNKRRSRSSHYQKSSQTQMHNKEKEQREFIHGTVLPIMWLGALIAGGALLIWAIAQCAVTALGH